MRLELYTEYTMGKALYRTYRSTSFDEVLGQDHITTTLKNALKSGHISHAYLLTGPRGVGKTSVARILAHAVNKLEYSLSGEHIDIIEIDAASNRRIDEIRELRERVMVVPTAAKYKVYIIDEVHMLTREAFNALLKTLEEPPAHVIFILATTEFHKLPDTIVSRCLRFNFKSIESATALAHLRDIADKENLKVDHDALELIAHHGDGSFRDSISRLDQIRGAGKHIRLEEVQRMLGVAPESQIILLLESITSGNAGQMTDVLANLYNYGAEPNEIAKQLSSVLRTNLLNDGLSLDHNSTLSLLKELLEIQSSSQAKALLELTLLDTLLDQQPVGNSVQNMVTRNEKAKKEVITDSTPTMEVVTNEEKNHGTRLIMPVSNKQPVAKSSQLPDTDSQSEETWMTILAALKSKNNTLYSIARMATTEFTDNKLILTFRFAFHHKKISDPKNKTIISDIVRSNYQYITELDVKLAEKNPNPDKSQIKKTTPADPSFSSITNIFGGGEVLES